eukprot:TRINITY_DN6624_c2_g1_i2.p1 TRINITY_DN6624_c2_g1~~TRINITY_DN6624_c2_g1_i2.p1  ORF type:complete len:293 (-),score=28.89 TRINITY_DN6624_c2_g1_i2:441-1319(-)
MSELGEHAKNLLTHTCQEFVHPESAKCGDYYLKMSYVMGLACLKTVFPIQFLNFLIQNKKDYRTLVLNILKQSGFIWTSTMIYGISLCQSRRVLGHNNRAAVLLSGFISLSIGGGFIKGKLKEMARYQVSVGLEAIIKMMMFRGYIKPIRHGMVGVFSITWGILNYMYQMHPEHMHGNDFFVRFINGSKEKPGSAEKVVSSIIGDAEEGTKKYAILGFLKSFMVGFAIKSLLEGLKAISSKAYKTSFIKFENFRFGLFLGLLSGISRVLPIYLPDAPISTFLTGAIAGIAEI